MADPITLMALVSMGTAAAGAAVKTMGAMQEGEAAQKMYAYKAGVAEQNRKYEILAGEVATQRQGLKARYEGGQALATQGASNLGVEEGSAPLVRESMHSVGVQEQEITRSNYARRAYGYEAEEGLDIASGKQAKIASKYKVAESILGGVSSVSDKWFAGQQAGMKIYG